MENTIHTYEWIKKVIDSCRTPIHFMAIDKLIKNFYNMHGDIDLMIALHKYQHKVQKQWL